MRQATLLEFLKPKQEEEEIFGKEETVVGEDAGEPVENEITKEDLLDLWEDFNLPPDKLPPKDNAEVILEMKDVKVEKVDNGIRVVAPWSHVIVPFNMYKLYTKLTQKFSNDISNKLQMLFSIRVKDDVLIFYQGDKGTSLRIEGVGPEDVGVLNEFGEPLPLSPEELEAVKGLAQGRLPITAEVPFGTEKILVNYEESITYLKSKKNKVRPIILGVPIEIEMLMVPDFPLAKWRTKWLSADGREITLVGLLHEIVSGLRQNGLIANKTKAEDVISALFVMFIKEGVGRIEYDYDKPGFYPTSDNSIKAVGIDLAKPDENELRTALKLLNELSTKWYADRIEKFATIIKWGIVAPFSFIMKKWNKGTDIVFPWIYLWGIANSGKTTMARIVLMMWGLGTRNIVGGAMIDNVPRFGQIVSSTTFPIVVNEVVLEKPEVIDAIKASIEGTVARGKFVAGNYITIPALAPLIMTSNRMPPMDAGLLRRLIVMNFTPKEKIRDEQKKKEFAKVLERAEALKAIGGFIAWFLSEHSELLKTKPWHEIAKIALEKAYEYAKLPKPKWLNMLYLGEQDSEDLTEELVIGKIKDMLVDCLVKLKRKWEADMDYENTITVIDIIASSNMCSWITKGRKDNNYVYLLAPILLEINKILPTQLSLKALAEVLGGDYVKVQGKMAVKISVEQLANHLVLNDDK